MPKACGGQGVLGGSRCGAGQARWQLVIENKYAEAYQFFSEASRQGLTVETFERQMRSVGVKSVTVKSVQCGAEQCQANLETVVEYAIPRIGCRSMPPR